MIGRARAVSGAMAPRDAVIAGIGRVFRHHRRVSAVLYVVGVLGVLSYPLLARRVFIDENAFLHGHGAIGFGADEALSAHEYALKAEGVIDALGADADGNAIYDALTNFAANELDALGLDVSIREYPIEFDRRGRRRASENAGDADSSVASRKTTHAVVRAVKSSGREGVVFATTIGASDTDGPNADAAAIGLGLAFVKYLATAKWLAKDFVWLVLDARPLGSNPGGSTHAAVHAADAWLREYYGDEASAARLGSLDASKNKGARGDASAFARAGALQQAYVIEMPAGAAVDVVAVRPEGRNGALPNQDLLNTAVQLSRRAFPRAKVGLDLDPLDPIETRARVGRAGEAKVREGEKKNVALIRRLSSFLERIGVFCLGKSRAFAVRQFVGDLRRASVFAWRCARGVPTGAHAAFKSFALDAATLRLGAPLGSARDKAHFGPTTTRETFRKIGSLLEMLARGSNNLIEQLHHSMFYYVMTSDDAFLSIAEYVAPQAAVVAAIAIVAIALATRGGDGDDGNGDGNGEQGARREHDWAPALALAAAARAAGAGVGYASLCFYDDALSPVATTGLTVLSALAAHALLAKVAFSLYAEGGGPNSTAVVPREPPWVTLKCVALASAATSTAAVTFFNFPLAWPTTVALAPVCLSVSQRDRSEGRRDDPNGKRPWRALAWVDRRTVKSTAMALTPVFLASLVSLIEETSPFNFAHHLAENARASRGGFAFPVAYAVVWPACALSALATRADVLRGTRGAGQREARAESKKSR